ncbi:MAG: S46 family peptidase [Salibacteraceae bacterium]
MLKFRISILLVALLLSNVRLVQASEGMWLPLLLKSMNEGDMQSRGFKLTAEDIYSINRNSMKDAVVHFGGGCTGEIISSEGLLLTNHHCGYSQIQSHSSLENDYLSNGFWAMSKEEELPNPGLTATFIIRMADVTWKVLDGVTESMSEEERQKLIKDNMEKIKAQETEGTHYDASIKAFYYGNEYYLFITETFKDVRLVGAPPSSIGKFGFDTDNWVWPRHTGDFSIFRIYANQDNQPAEYSKDNVPFTPRHHFPINLNGVEEGDFTMVYGFPGRTEEYLPSYAVDYVLNVGNPAKIESRRTSLSIIDAAMRSDAKVRIQYAAKQSRISNAYKKWIGQSRGLKRLKAIEMKEKVEAEFTAKVNEKPKYKEDYGQLLPQFKEKYEAVKPYSLARDYFIEIFYYGPEILRFASGWNTLLAEATKAEVDEAKLQEEIEKQKRRVKGFFKNYHQPTDEKLFAAMMPLYQKGVQANLQPDVFTNLVAKKYGNDFEKYGDFIYGKTLLMNEANLLSILDKFSGKIAKKMKADPAIILTNQMLDAYWGKVRPTYSNLKNDIDRLMRTYMDAQRILLPKPNYYPDANSTLRLTYGKMEGYNPADAVTYRSYTTLSGIAQKYIPESYEFDVPGKLLDLYETKDYGLYGKNGEMRVCFIASNHTSGGNSGSPVIDGEGNLIGLNFDRTWESTMSDIVYDPTICRNIAVDIRYVLFIIDKFAGASHLISEMDLIHADLAAKKEAERAKIKAELDKEREERLKGQ